MSGNRFRPCQGSRYALEDLKNRNLRFQAVEQAAVQETERDGESSGRTNRYEKKEERRMKTVRITS